MGNFSKNVLRLAFRNKLSVLSSVLIIAIGIFVMVSMLDTLQNLAGQISEYYKETNMADIFVEVDGISEAELRMMTDIEGIAEADGRISEDIRLVCEGQKELSTVHLISYKEDARVNAVTRTGNPVNENDIFVGMRMSGFYNFRDNEKIRLISKGDSVDFEYRGTMNAPDYIYSISGNGAMVPDGETYDVACIPLKRMEELTGKSDSYNELGFVLESGYSYDDVKYSLASSLGKYGLKSMQPVKDQVSYEMVKGEMNELISTGVALPILFLLISIFMLYVVLKKMIDRDQVIIGSMKAFGFTNRELIVAYIIEGAFIGFIGAVIGAVLAYPFGKYMFDMYMDFFNLSETSYHIYWNTRIISLILALVTSISAVFLGVRSILKITPATAMKSKAPKTVRGLYVIRSSERFNTMIKLGLRAVVRNPFRGFLIVLAVTFPFSLSSALFNFVPTVNNMVENQFSNIQSFDLMLSLDRFVSPENAMISGMQLNEVEKSEAICQLPIEISNENLTDFGILFAMPKDMSLWNIMDTQKKFYKPPDNGIILNQRIADKLNVGKGDTVKISGTGLTIEKVELPVTDTISEIFGGGCYISMDEFARVFNSAPSANKVLLDIEDSAYETVKNQINGTSRVMSIVDTSKIIESYKDIIKSMIYMTNFFAFLSIVAGIVLIYNISMINIKERFTEIGTLMVLGASTKEIGKMIMFEHGIYFVLGILLGIPGSFGMKKLIEYLVISDSYNITMLITPWSYILTFVICAAMILVAWQREMKLIEKIALTDILKERD